MTFFYICETTREFVKQRVFVKDNNKICVTSHGQATVYYGISVGDSSTMPVRGLFVGPSQRSYKLICYN